MYLCDIGRVHELKHADGVELFTYKYQMEMMMVSRGEAHANGQQRAALEHNVAAAQEAFRGACVAAVGSGELADTEAALSAVMQRCNEVTTSMTLELHMAMPHSCSQM